MCTSGQIYCHTVIHLQSSCPATKLCVLMEIDFSLVLLGFGQLLLTGGCHSYDNCPKIMKTKHTILNLFLFDNNILFLDPLLNNTKISNSCFIYFFMKRVINVIINVPPECSITKGISKQLVKLKSSKIFAKQGLMISRYSIKSTDLQGEIVQYF